MAEFDLVVCPTCQAADFDTLTEERFRALKCRGCGLGIETKLSGAPAGDYTQAYDLARNNGAGGSRWARFHHDSAVAALRLGQLAGVLAGVRPRLWVDVGCGNGALLAVARRNGWDVTGVEAEAACADAVANLLGVPVLSYAQWAAVGLRIGGNRPGVGVVSFMDSLEHVLDYPGALMVAGASIVPGGLVVVEAPDLDDAADNFATWKHRRISSQFTEHVWHFSPASLTKAADRYLPGCESVWFSKPVPGRFQAAFRKKDEQRPIEAARKVG